MRRALLIFGWVLWLVGPSVTRVCAQTHPFTELPPVPRSSATQTIDGVAARIEDDVLMESEIRELAAFQQLADGKAKTRVELIEELEDQWIVRGEANATKYPPPLAEEVNRAYTQFVKQFPSLEEFQKRCAAAGLTEAAVRRILAQQLFLSRFIDYRFQPTVQVDEKQIETYYHDEFAPQLKARGQAIPPLADVEDTIREVLVQRAINERATQWLDETRKHLKVDIVSPGEWIVKFRWRKWLKGALFFLLALVLAIFIALESGITEKWICPALVRQIQQRTGARVELKGCHIHLWSLRTELDDLTLHGLEGAGMPPLFHADRVDVAIRIVSFFSKRIALDELIAVHPQMAVEFDKNGRSNLPHPKVTSSNRPWRESLFQLQIGRLELRDGSGTFNDQRVPLAMQGRNFEFVLHRGAASAEGESYVGDFRWQQVELALKRDLPFRFDIATKFTLHRDSFTLDELICKLPHSELNLRAELPSFASADWNFRYRGRLSLADVRTIFRERLTPDGIADFSGQARFASGEWTGSGHYAGRDIQMRYQWFHARALESWGDYEIAQKRLVVPNLSVRAFGGSLGGRLEMDLPTLAFRTETHLHGANLAAALAAVDNDEFPVTAMHWDGLMDVDSVNTWVKNFKEFRTQGTTRWSPPLAVTLGTFPVTAEIQYDYSEKSRMVSISQGEIHTAASDLSVDGFLGAVDSGLEVDFHTSDLTDWDDFINVLCCSNASPHRFGGEAGWRGRIIGPLGGPTFFGQLHALHVAYDKLVWDQMDGALEYSPDDFHLTKTTVRRGETSAAVDLSLQFDGDWSFQPESPWKLEARVTHAPMSDVQSMFETAYPVKGLLNGDIHGSGTRASPILDADFTVNEIEAKGFHFDRLSGALHIAGDEWRLSRTDLRKGSGNIAGDILYRPEEQQIEFNATGSALSLDSVEFLQNFNVPFSGQLDFALRGSGPLRALVTQGDWHLVNVKIRSDTQGNFLGNISSDGSTARISIASEGDREKFNGEAQIGLTGEQLISGKLSVKQLDMDAFIVAGLHLKQLTGHSSVDGTFTVTGSLRQPDSIEVAANISQIGFNYESVQLQNDGPVRLSYRRNEVRIDQLRLHGTDTDLQLSGSARFDRDRPIHLVLSGNADLRVVTGFIPDLDARGAAQMNVTVDGTLSHRRITGHASVRDASAHYADFPTGLNHMNGDFVFDQSRLLFERITAESGGGQLALNGSVTYGEGILRYEINVNTEQVRIRYPEGMSWLAGGRLQLAGTSDSAILSGQIEVKRLLFAQGVDVASFFAAASDTSIGPGSSSAFLRNLSFDIAARTSPGTQIEWTGAQIEMDGDVHLRGTWDHPVLLGNVHLLGGEMVFRGSKFELARGDINFANPFRLDPVLNVEATTVISQYQVTINFSGPASRLSLNYRSDPPLPDSDIVSLLAIGSPGEGSAFRSQGSNGQNYGATALLSEAISSGLGGPIERLFGVSHFRVDPFLAETATESNAAARVTISQQVTHDLNVTYSSNTSASQYQLIQVEYTVKHDLSVIFLRDINGTYGFDIKFVRHFK